MQQTEGKLWEQDKIPSNNEVKKKELSNRRVIRVNATQDVSNFGPEAFSQLRTRRQI